MKLSHVKYLYNVAYSQIVVQDFEYDQSNLTIVMKRYLLGLTKIKINRMIRIRVRIITLHGRRSDFSTPLVYVLKLYV